MKRRALRILTPVLAAVLVFIAVYTFFTEYWWLVQPHGGYEATVTPLNGTTCKLRILYYDPLALEHDNKTLIHVLERIAAERGACMSIYTGNAAGLKPLMNLSAYDIVIIRAHGGLWDGRGFYFATGIEAGMKPDIPSKLFEQLVAEGAIAAGSPAVWNRGALEVAPAYIVVGAGLFKHVKLKKDAVVVVASCDSLDDQRFVHAVLEAGARAYIGWVGTVTPADIDRALPTLLSLLLSHFNNPCSVTRLLLERGLLRASTGAVLGAVCR